jgi:hypothetical protein
MSESGQTEKSDRPPSRSVLPTGLTARAVARPLRRDGESIVAGIAPDAIALPASPQSHRSMMCCRRIHASRKREAPTIPRPRTRHGQNKNIENNPMQTKVPRPAALLLRCVRGRTRNRPRPDLIPRQNAPRRVAPGVCLESSHPLRSEGAGNAGCPMAPAASCARSG